MATKTRKVKKPRTDSPITVGGGGGKRLGKKDDPTQTRIKFNRNAYVRDGDVWKNAGLELASLELNGQPIPNVTVTAKTRVQIGYRRGLFDHTIVINEGPMGVRFYEDHFPYDPDMSQQQHHGRAEITELKIGNRYIPLPARVRIDAHTRAKQRQRR